MFGKKDGWKGINILESELCKFLVTYCAASEEDIKEVKEKTKAAEVVGEATKWFDVKKLKVISILHCHCDCEDKILELYLSVQWAN